MKSSLNHVQLNIEESSQSFYKELFTLLGWSVLHEDPNMLGMADAKGASIWASSVSGKSANDYNNRGVNHVGIETEAQSDIDEVTAFLKKKNIAALFDTPRHRSEFAASAADTYYQVMFESPDRILFEVKYSGPRAK